MTTLKTSRLHSDHYPESKVMTLTTMILTTNETLIGIKKCMINNPFNSSMNSHAFMTQKLSPDESEVLIEKHKLPKSF